MRYQLAAIGLIIGILLPSASAVLMYRVARSQIRSRIEEQIAAGKAEDGLVLLHIPRRLEDQPNADFRRFHATEFRYKGIMYDVVRQEAKGDTTLYWCIADIEDTQLQNQWDNYWARGSRSDNPAQRAAEDRLFQFWQSLFVHSLPPVNHLFGSGASSKPRPCANKYSSVSRPIPQPPPEPLFPVLVQC
ncbi:MAG TPA: hypothetical protein PK198_00630 [Saprospiraceae bacterium]|nr:hypothetical protein [Saprospiraceae bacterium]HRF37265.1 hypothetical protein [Saprospiraceae bacterium]HRJ15334.1 hypothetical protein [Saprospiraceae bacterium]HRK82169.1 hypothetical protein [Saprospiraceae bacterium]